MYNRLFASILDSSVWLEDNPTRIVWFTFLAAMDSDGFARFASIRNLSSRARVTDDEARSAVAVLEAPDPESSDPDNEGRRIERVPGGWMILNAGKYHATVSRIIAREKNRQRVAKFREKSRSNACVMTSNEPSQNVTPPFVYVSGSDLDHNLTGEKDLSDQDHLEGGAGGNPKDIDDRSDPNPSPGVRMARSFEQPSGDAKLLFEAWKVAAAKPGAGYDHSRRQFFERIHADGVTVDIVEKVVRGAKLDRWATDEAKLSPSAILGSAEQREKYMALADKPPKPKGRGKVQPNATDMGAKPAWKPTPFKGSQP